MFYQLSSPERTVPNELQTPYKLTKQYVCPQPTPGDTGGPSNASDLAHKRELNFISYRFCFSTRESFEMLNNRLNLSLTVKILVSVVRAFWTIDVGLNKRLCTSVTTGDEMSESCCSRVSSTRQSPDSQTPPAVSNIIILLLGGSFL